MWRFYSDLVQGEGVEEGAGAEGDAGVVVEGEEQRSERLRQLGAGGQAGQGSPEQQGKQRMRRR